MIEMFSFKFKKSTGEHDMEKVKKKNKIMLFLQSAFVIWKRKISLSGESEAVGVGTWDSVGRPSFA